MSALPPSINARARAWAWWLLPVIALALLIGWEIDWGRHLIRVPAAPAPVEPKPIVAEVLPEYRIDGGLPANAETVNRTLFNATRRPAPVLAGGAGPTHLTANQFLLVGTTVTGEKNIAFLREVAGGKSRVVKQGDQLNGMTVASIEKDRVKFTLNDESDELFLKVAPGPKTTLAAAPPAPAAAAPVAAAAAGPPAATGTAARAARAAQAAAAAATTTDPNAQQQNRAQRRAARQAASGGAFGPGPPATDGGGTGTSGGGGRQRQQ